MALYTLTAKYFRHALQEFTPVLKDLIKETKSREDLKELEYLLEAYSDIAEKIDGYNLNLEDPNRDYDGEPHEVDLGINDNMIEHLVRLTLRLLDKWKNDKEQLESRDYLTEKREEELLKLKKLIWPLEAFFNAPSYVFHKYKGKGPIEFPGEKTSSNNTERNNEQYDIFICHASEDKKSFVEPLAKELQNSGIRVWYDNFVLGWGDDLLSSIDKGVVKSRYGIVVFSKSFLKMKKKWTRYELNSLFAKEKNGIKVILPIWYNITKEDLLKYAPGFVDRIAKISSKDSIDDIVNEVKRLLRRNH